MNKEILNHERIRECKHCDSINITYVTLDTREGMGMVKGVCDDCGKYLKAVKILEVENDDDYKEMRY